MYKKTYLYLLILCGSLCQGNIATLSDEDTRKSSDLLVRKKRVINHLPNGVTPTPIENASFMVIIKEYNRASCAGVIMSHNIVLTASHCISHELLAYTIFSGSAYDHRSKTHNITSKIDHYGNVPHELYDGVALLSVQPIFVYSEKTRGITLHTGLLPIATQGSVFGWGCIYPPKPGPRTRQRRLRSITVPIMNHRECQNLYRGFFAITEKNICTYDEQQYCAHTDAGAPLVVEGKLVGIHVWKGELSGQMNPDVFLDLKRDDYSTWIREHTFLRRTTNVIA